MKRLAALVLVVVMIFTLTGVASASAPVTMKFTITGGYTSIPTCKQLSNGLASFHASSAGDVEGSFHGKFTMEEWGVVAFNCATGAGSGKGNNVGTLTITDGDKVVVGFAGEVDATTGVKGEYVLQQKNGTGSHRLLGGYGAYTGSGGDPFMVTFTGKFN